jgi:hypothetical protein
MYSPGDVVRFHSYVAGEKKYHLCISLRGHFLFVNSPKTKTFRGDFVVPCTDIPCLDPTDSGKSIISCSVLVRMSDEELRHVEAKKLGVCAPRILRDLIKFVEQSPVLSPDEKDAIIDELGDWI